MKRFILVTFLFLGWAFYEMSGGADFDPPQRAEAPPAPPEPTPYIPEERIAEEKPEKPATIVFKPATQPGTGGTAALPEPANSVSARETADAGDRTTEVEQNERLNQVRSSLTQGLTLYSSGSSSGQGLTLASLGSGNVTSASSLDTPATGGTEEQSNTVNAAVDSLLQQTATPEASPNTPPDIREVTGVRVNMRDGPGTIYPVIAKLNIGQQVEILSDSGTGWLRLRTLPQNQPGWIAQSLVSKAAN